MRCWSIIIDSLKKYFWEVYRGSVRALPEIKRASASVNPRTKVTQIPGQLLMWAPGCSLPCFPYLLHPSLPPPPSLPRQKKNALGLQIGAFVKSCCGEAIIRQSDLDVWGKSYWLISPWPSQGAEGSTLIWPLLSLDLVGWPPQAVSVCRNCLGFNWTH